MNQLTAETINEVFKLMAKDKRYEEILVRYFDSLDSRNEFRQELYLIILENQQKMLNHFNSMDFFAIYAGIIKNQIKSTSSDYHKKIRHTNETAISNSHGNSNNYKMTLEKLMFDYISTTHEPEHTVDELMELIQRIRSKAIRNKPILERDFRLMDMYYTDGLNYRQISEKTKIPSRTVCQYIQNAVSILRTELNKQLNK